MRHGILLIDKPAGQTSHDSVAAVRATFSERKIGHLGTLDPAATGLLVLAVGAKALKCVELFADLGKEYEAVVQFGAVSSTYDKEGVIEQVTRGSGVEEPDERAVCNAIEDRFLGKIEQVPPAHSAVKIGGERAYRKARQGRVVDMPSREVEVTACDVIAYAYPELKLHIACSSGTYIRSFAHDLGHLLRVGGYLGALRRTKVGKWNVADAASERDARWTDVIPLKEVLAARPRMELSDGEAEAIRHGRTITREDVKENTIAWYDELPIAILKREGAGECRARKVL